MKLLVILMLIGILVISGCGNQSEDLEVVELNECIQDLNVFESYFGVDKENFEIIYSECETCSPWYTPQVKKFGAKVIDKEGDEYIFSFLGGCARHAQSISKTCLSTDIQSTFYSILKESTCNKLDRYNNKSYIQACKGGQYENLFNGKRILSFSSYTGGSDNPFSGAEELEIQNCWDLLS